MRMTFTDVNSQAKFLGEGPCKSRVDVETQDAKPFLYVMDGIQKAGAEAWVRIIHKDIYGKVNPVIPNSTNPYIPFSTIITNKSGIKEASLCYTTDGNQWFEVKLTANGNCWHADVPLSDFTGGQPIPANGIQVSYYLSATSNNGKTVTKPINAQKGSLYDFTITSAVEYDKNQFDYATEPAPVDQIKFYIANSLIREDTSVEPTPTGIVEIEDGNGGMDNVRKG